MIDETAYMGKAFVSGSSLAVLIPLYVRNTLDIKKNDRVEITIKRYTDMKVNDDVGGEER